MFSNLNHYLGEFSFFSQNKRTIFVYPFDPRVKSKDFFWNGCIHYLYSGDFC